MSSQRHRPFAGLAVMAAGATVTALPAMGQGASGNSNDLTEITGDGARSRSGCWMCR